MGISRRILVASDLHCGHISGLTPKEFHHNNEIIKIAQEEMWEFWCEELYAFNKEKKIDLAIINGDIIEGYGDRGCRGEVFCNEMLEQANIASRCIYEIGAPSVVIVRGTPYHTGVSERYEKHAVEVLKGTYGMVDVSMEYQATVRHKGVIIRARHFVTGGGVPTTRGNAIGKEVVWDIIKSDQDEMREPSTVIFRSHVHYSYEGEVFGRRFIITPCMKGMYDEYGQTKCSGTIDIGFGVLDIMDDGSVIWRKRILKPQYQSEKVKEL